MASVRAQEKVFNFDASFSISDDKLLHSLTLRRGLYKRRFFRISLTGCFNFAIHTHRRESEIKRSSLVARAGMLLKRGTGSGERGAGNGERKSGNELSAETSIKIQYGR